MEIEMENDYWKEDPVRLLRETEETILEHEQEAAKAKRPEMREWHLKEAEKWRTMKLPAFIQEVKDARDGVTPA